MEAERKWTAIILAGRRPGEDDFAAANGVAAKALIPVGGTPMLGRVARTVLGAPSVDRVIVLTQEPEALLTGPLNGWLKIRASKPPEPTTAFRPVSWPSRGQPPRLGRCCW